MSDHQFSKTFCALPWTHLATYTDGSTLPCCVAENDSGQNLNQSEIKQVWNSEYFRTLRKKMLLGEKISGCKRCYIEEESGYKSHRIMENEVWQRRLGSLGLQELVGKTGEDGSYDGELMSLDLRLGNLCNLQCVMCRPQDSSKWLSLATKMKERVKSPVLQGDVSGKLKVNQESFKWYQQDHIWKDVEESLPHIREIIIGGGEPLIVDEHQRLLDLCITSGEASHILLRYHTNGTVLPEALFEQWSHFERVEIFLSLDAIGERCNYVRYPSKWETLKAHLFRLEEMAPDNMSVMLLCSIHALNLFYLDEFSNWVEGQGFSKIGKDFSGHFHPGIVHSPEFLSPQVYPEKLKAVVTEKLLEFEMSTEKPSQKVLGLIHFMNEADKSHLLPDLMEYVHHLDKIRGTNFSQTFPELNKHLNFY